MSGERSLRLAAASLGALLALAVPGVTAVAARPATPGAGRVPAVVRRATPAVVSITTRQIEHDQFNQLVRTRGLGSGIIVDPRGYILTSLHVVDGAEEIKVTLTDGRNFRARLVGGDPFSELAVLKVKGGALPTLRLAASARLAVGQTVVAIGNPLWLEGGPTVTVGVVSALGRSIEEDGLPVLHDLIQTDAAINPGNSGGPLLNLAGEVVGINTALIPSAHGIGFAVSAATAAPVLRALITAGRVVRPSLGLRAVSVTPQVAYANDLPMDRGALVLRVDRAGPADAAGVQAGDVVMAVDGSPVASLHTLHRLLERHPIGQGVALELWRQGETVTRYPVVEEYRR